MLDPYEMRKDPKERPWYRPALELIKNIPTGKALDLGCGLAEFSQKLQATGFDVVCTDGSKKYVENANKLGFEARIADFNNPLPFADAEFNLISSLEVIEHVEKAEQFISEMYRILRPGGYLLISTPNYAFVGVRLKMLFGKPIPGEGYHFRFFTYTTLKKLMKKSGFRIRKEKGISFLPFYKLTKKTPSAISIPFFKKLLASKTMLLVQK